MSAPSPSFDYNLYPRSLFPWKKWLLVAGGIILISLTWRCGSAMYQGKKLSDNAVRRFHQQFNNAQYQDIAGLADETLSQGTRRSELLEFLVSVHRKLGDAGDGKQTNMNVNAATDGTFITADYDTAFTEGQAHEVFTWRKSGNQLKLYAYNVESEALLK